MSEPVHMPVLADRVTALLAPALASPGAVLVDATLGRAGHARALLDACPGLLLIGIDADEAAIEAARVLLARYADRVTLVHARYDEIPAIVAASRGPAGWSGGPRGPRGPRPGSGSTNASSARSASRPAAARTWWSSTICTARTKPRSACSGTSARRCGRPRSG